MTVSPIGSSSTPDPTGTTKASGTTLGRDQFLNLLVTQLKNQDPMSPLQPYEFAAQLAQFSTVEQLTQLNTALGSQTQDVQLVATLGRTNLSASLVGRHVLAEGDQLKVTAGQAQSVTLDVPGSGGTGTLVLTDAAGHQVATRSLGVIAPGRQTVALPSDLPAGSYTYKVTFDQNGKTVNATTYVSGTVDKVMFKNGDIQLDVNGIEIPMDTISEIDS